jgi:hypothetical protein
MSKGTAEYGRNPTGRKGHRPPRPTTDDHDRQPMSMGTAEYGRNPTGRKGHRPPGHDRQPMTTTDNR